MDQRCHLCELRPLPFAVTGRRDTCRTSRTGMLSGSLRGRALRSTKSQLGNVPSQDVAWSRLGAVGNHEIGGAATSPQVARGRVCPSSSCPSAPVEESEGPCESHSSERQRSPLLPCVPTRGLQAGSRHWAPLCCHQENRWGPVVRERETPPPQQPGSPR